MVDAINVNVGVLGHVDSGKTSLSRVLSQVASTAAFDKSTESRARGITIDLGFSSFSLPLPRHWPSSDGNPKVQVTLVDCPGHASLIRTIISGAQIIDMMMLVVDVTKGIQTQTAECLVIGQITANKMVVVLNKIDLIPPEKRDAVIDKMKKRLMKTLEQTKFADSVLIPVSAKPAGGDGEPDPSKSIGMQDLIDAISDNIPTPVRSASGSFMYAVDHCFLIKGQGTILTGTVIQGSVKVNDTIEIPSIKATKKVKSIQMFKKPINQAMQGDRIGLCVTQLDSKLIERGIVCSPGLVNHNYAAIAQIEKVPYFKGECRTKSKFHVTVVHDTAMARVHFFTGKSCQPFDFSLEYNHCMQLGDDGAKTGDGHYVLLEFERPVLAYNDCLLIGSKLDTDINANLCRLAFHGRCVALFSDKNYRTTALSNLLVYKMKSKQGVVERFNSEYELIAKSMFKKETNMQKFVGLKVKLSSGEDGVIDGAFGQSGKTKIRIPNGIADASLVSKSKKTATNTGTEPITVNLAFKRYVYDSTKKMIQK